MLRLEWLPSARDDLADILLYIEQRNPRAAVNLRQIIEAGAEKLPFMPLAFRSGRVSGTREYLVHPNYILVYRITGDTVEVVRIMHARREYP